jgi:hypothetical protein
MDLKASLRRAQNLAIEQLREMVVGDDGSGAWVIMTLDDPRSDALRPGFIVGAQGLRYPEDHDLAVRLMAQGR